MNKLNMISKLKNFKLIIASIIIVITLIASHITPKVALRFCVFISGHPIKAFVTSIVDDELHNKIDSEFLQKEHAHCYILTIPVVEKQTDSCMCNYIVRKKWIFYFAQYYGEV